MEEQSMENKEQGAKIKLPDWSPYANEEFRAQISQITYQINGQDYHLTYIPPQERSDLREKLITFLTKSSNAKPSDKKISFLLILLNFLEKGQMRDNFGADEKARHNFLLNNKVRIKTADGEEEINLYQLSKKVNKLAGNPISTILLTAEVLLEEGIDESPQLTETIESLKNQVYDTRKNIINIKNNAGYFTPEDLKQVDNLAQLLFNYLIEN